MATSTRKGKPLVRIRLVSRWLAAVPVVAAIALPFDSVQAQTPFKALEGVWSGAGRIVLDSGNSERLSCRANYIRRSSGDALGLSIRCASSSYKIELRASLAHAAGSVSGNWEERTFNAEGTLSGKASSNALQLAFRGNISGSMSVIVAERQQQVSITTAGTGFRGVSISLSKS